jgi:hypothetical protein
MEPSASLGAVADPGAALAALAEWANAPTAALMAAIAATKPRRLTD